jgi:sulfatase maturation enzyme AslB (radical SAM superfamily)
MKNKETHAIIPSQVDIDLTNICNQNCFYCNSADHRARLPVQKNYKEYIKLLDKLASWRAHTPNSFGSLHTITYPGGGEPTIAPNYEKVIEHTIDLGFLTSLTTNGTKLEKLIENVSVDKLKKMGWIGIDIDAGNVDMYEKIRRSLTSTSPFEKVMRNAKELVNMGVVVDFKILLGDKNSTFNELKSIFIKAKEIGVRLVYFRPVIMHGTAFQFTDELLLNIETLSHTYKVTAKINKNKFLPREYNRCHQMFQFPVFCADGEIYTCCENKGNPLFSIGKWDENDFRDLWLSKRHFDVYNSVNTHLCQPCRPNLHNNRIQHLIDNPALLEILYT